MALPTATKTLERRFAHTLAFMDTASPRPARILDLGTPNTLSERMQAIGFDVQNTEGDLDETPAIEQGRDVEAVTAFEILEHHVAPFIRIHNGHLRPPRTDTRYHWHQLLYRAR